MSNKTENNVINSKLGIAHSWWRFYSISGSLLNCIKFSIWFYSEVFDEFLWSKLEWVAWFSPLVMFDRLA